MTDSPSCVLLMRLSALGDVAMTIPEVYDACISNPDVSFLFLTKPLPAQLFVNAPKNLQVIVPDLKRYRGISGLYKLYSRLHREYNIDTVVDLHDVARTKILRAFFRSSGVHVSYICKGRRAKHALTRRNGKVLLPLKPMTERYEDALWRGHIYCEHNFRSIYVTGPGPEAAFSKVTAPKQQGEKWIAVAPFARHRGKIYPVSLMKKVTDTLAERENVKIFLFGAGDEEEKILREMTAGRTNIIDMASVKSGLPSELSLLSHCDVMLSMDSANMHLASLVALPAVTIWGATHPYAGFLGYGQSLHNAVQLDITCRPCSVFGDKPCSRGDYLCLHGITPSLIISRLDPYL